MVHIILNRQLARLWSPVLCGAVVICTFVASLNTSSIYLSSCDILNESCSKVESSNRTLVDLHLRQSEIPATGLSIFDGSGDVLSVVPFLESPVENDYVLRIEAKTSGYSQQMLLSGGEGTRARIQIEIQDRQRVRVVVNDEVVYGFRWNKKWLPSFTNKVDARPSIEAWSGQRASVHHSESLSLVEGASASLVMAVVGTLSFLGGVRTQRSPQMRLQHNQHDGNLRSRTLVLWTAACLTVVSVITGLFTRRNASGYFSDDGISLSSAARFSDWYQVQELARYAQPYEGGDSQYPPFALALFRLIPTEATPYVLVTLASFVLGSAISSFCQIEEQKRFTRVLAQILGPLLLFYPMLYAVDRGSTDLLTVSLLFLFCTYLASDRDNHAAVVLGTMAAFKVFPLILALVFIGRPHLRRTSSLIVVTAGSLTIFGSYVLVGEPFSAIRSFLESNTSPWVILRRDEFISARGTSIFQWMSYVGRISDSPISQATFDRAINMSLVIVALLSVSVLRALRGTLFGPIEGTFIIILLVVISGPIAHDYRLLLLLPCLSIKSNLFVAREWVAPTILGLAIGSKHVAFFDSGPFTLGGVLTTPLLVLVLLIKVAELGKTATGNKSRILLTRHQRYPLSEDT